MTFNDAGQLNESYDTVGLNGTPLTENMLFHVVIVADQLDANG